MAVPQFSMFSFRKDVLWLEIGMGCSALLVDESTRQCGMVITSVEP